jgi:Tfp pilus assembly protein PilF
VKKDRIYAEFKSVEDLKTKAVQSLVELRGILEVPDAQQIQTSIALPSKPIASADELQITLNNTHQSRHPCHGASVGDLNIELVREFASKVAPELIADKTTTDDTLPFRLGLLSAIPEVGKLIPHNSAILCFSDSPQKYLPQAKASFSVGEENADDFILKRVEGPLYRQISALVQLVLNELRTKVSFDQKGRRVEAPEIPNDVIREVISNAVSHRDYSQAATGNVHVRVRKDTIEITNPGSFPSDFSWDTFLNFEGVSSPKDAFVAYFLTIQLAFEGIGRGFRIFREYIKQNGEEAITFEQYPGTVRVRVRRPNRVELAAEAISNVPISIPTQFVGRDDDLASLDKALKGGEGRAAITALHGLRGVGKTALAAAYAYRHRGEYRATWWIRAETESTMRADLVGLGVRLGWVAADAPEEQSLRAILDRLRDEGNGILLIYDSAISPRELSKFIPRGAGPRIIVTSNAPNWGGIAALVEIGVWPKEVGADFLMARTGRMAERDAALALSDALGGLPLAHEQSAAYCERVGVSLVEYRERFHAAPAKLLNDARDASREYHGGLTVEKTFALAIDEAAKRHSAAEPLIVYAALLAPEPIPLYLFSEGREKFAEPFASLIDEDGLNDAVAALRAFALVERELIPDERDASVSTDCIRLHRLVRQVAASRRDLLEQRRIRGELIEAMAVAYPSGAYSDPNAWLRARRLDAIALALVDGDDAQSEATDSAQGYILNALAVYRQGALAAYADARPYYERALALRERALGPEHPDSASSLNNLGALLRAQGDLAAARTYYERALAIRERTLGPAHPDTASSLNNLGLLLRTQGDLAGARAYYERALAINEKALGPERPGTATSLNNLGYLLAAQGDFAGARHSLERALAIREKALGPDHPDTAVSLNNLGGLLHDQGDLVEARRHYQRALAIYEKVLGPDHPSTQTVAKNFVNLLDRLALWNEAAAIRQKFDIKNKG